MSTKVDSSNNEGMNVSPTIVNAMFPDAYLMAGKYYYSKGGSSEKIEKDTIIEEQIDLGEYIAVKIKGFDYGSFAVFDRNKILDKPRTRKVVFRKKPCQCQKVGWGKTEWMAGVPIYCKSVFNGSYCPLMKQTENLFECNYEKALVKDYIKMCDLNEIEVERITVSF